MKIQDCLNIFGLEPGCTQDQIKARYKELAIKYHPDRNPSGLKMMQMINAAHDILKTYSGYAFEFTREEDLAESLANAINFIVHLPVKIEVCGSWVWVSGNTKPFKEILKQAGFKWANAKKMWYFRPDTWQSSSRGKWDISKIREKYGSSTVKNKEREGIEV